MRHFGITVYIEDDGRARALVESETGILGTVLARSAPAVLRRIADLVEKMQKVEKAG